MQEMHYIHKNEYVELNNIGKWRAKKGTNLIKVDMGKCFIVSIAHRSEAFHNENNSVLNPSRSNGIEFAEENARA